MKTAHQTKRTFSFCESLIDVLESGRQSCCYVGRMAVE